MTDRMIDSGANDFADNPYNPELCYYCGGTWERDGEWDIDDMGMIRYIGWDGTEMVCCADCFYDMIGWTEMQQHTNKQGTDYREALDILENRVRVKTGIHVVDEHEAELTAFLRRMVEIETEVALTVRRMKKIGGAA